MIIDLICKEVACSLVKTYEAQMLKRHFLLQVIKVDHEAHGVDVPEDVDKIESFMKERNIT